MASTKTSSRVSRSLMMATAFAALTGVALFAPSANAAAAQQNIEAANAARPNIILVVLDDIGYSDLGAYGSEIKTPNIDALARKGLRYTKFDTNAVCSATRASLLTGRNSQTVKMGFLAAQNKKFLRIMTKLGQKSPQLAAYAKETWKIDPGWRDPKDHDFDRGWMPRNAETMAQALKSGGYVTWALGKWHLAPKWEDGKKGNNIDFPLQRGFDYFYGYRDGWTDQYRPILYKDNKRISIPRYPYGKMLTWDLINHAISKVKETEAAGSHKPFFMYLALPVAHAPIQVTQPYINAYDGVYDKGWDAIREERLKREKKLGVVPKNAVLAPRNPGDPAWKSLTDEQKRVYARYMQTYAGYIQYGDQQLGRLLAYLRRSGVSRNTLIVLLSDNGPAGESKGGGFYQPYMDHTSVAQMAAHLNELGGPQTEPMYQRAWAMAGATPYRRYKLWPYLGGVRDDLIVSWPGHITKPGSVRHQYVHAVDIAPTLLAAAGLHFDKRVDGVKQIPVAGRSFLASLSDQHAPSARNTQYFLLLGNRAITAGKWRAIAVHKPGTPHAQDRWQLFNLAKDPTEIHNLAKSDPAELKRMQALWQSQAKKYGATPFKKDRPFWIWDQQFFQAFLPKEDRNNY